MTGRFFSNSCVLQLSSFRIAELLSQLPPELDIESMVMRTLAASRPNKGGLGAVTRVPSGAPGKGERRKSVMTPDNMN